MYFILIPICMCYSFSDVHDRVSWLTNKMEAAVTDLTNTLKNLEDSCANKHTEFAATVTTTLEANHVLVDKKITQLEKVYKIIILHSFI